VKSESLVNAVGAPIVVWFGLSKLPGISSQVVLFGVAISIVVNLTTLKGTASFQFQERQTFLDALDRLFRRSGSPDGRAWLAAEDDPER